MDQGRRGCLRLAKRDQSGVKAREIGESLSATVEKTRSN